MPTLKTGTALGVGSLGILLAFAWGRRRRGATNRAVASRTVTIRAEASALHDLWREPDRLASVFRGAPIEVVHDTPGRLLEWRTTRNAPFRGGGSITFESAPAERGTQTRMALHIEGPAARTAAAFMRLFGTSPAQLAMESLRQFKALVEAGEIPRAVRA
jgi:uncharacterized membrane protein